MCLAVLPSHVTPSPVKPELHKQVNVPGSIKLCMQLAFCEQLLRLIVRGKHGSAIGPEKSRDMT